ncbi:unnamed protein product, partial [Onchocerca flexuosa]|uniref:PET domain-containing protein n=1 Tax=Onchocerca flexuosa TaxID=387005 RepID=A0A183HFG4_9BILA
CVRNSVHLHGQRGHSSAIVGSPSVFDECRCGQCGPQRETVKSEYMPVETSKEEFSKLKSKETANHHLNYRSTNYPGIDSLRNKSIHCDPYLSYVKHVYPPKIDLKMAITGGDNDGGGGGDDGGGGGDDDDGGGGPNSPLN